VRQHLGLHIDDCEVLGSTAGVHRDIGYRYPRAFGSELTKEHVLLEMGSRGGTNPHDTHSLRSLAANYAIDILGEQADEWAEFQPVDIAVLAPERTLLEKLALLHDRATSYPDSDQARYAMALAGRHFYDVHQRLSNPHVRAALTELCPDGVREIVADIDERSQAAGWRSTPRPEGGYADSPAFQHNAPSTQTAEASYALALGMVYGEHPTVTECIATVQAQRDLL